MGILANVTDGIYKIETIRKMPRQKPGRSKQNYATPPEFIAAVEKRWGALTWDLAAEPTTAKAPGWFTKEEDAFKQDWFQCGSHLWLNPPFGQITKWAKACFAFNVQARKGQLGIGDVTIELLVPASVGANWFAKYVWPYADVFALQGRLSFDGKNPFPKDCMLCRYTSESGGFLEIWDWRK